MAGMSHTIRGAVALALCLGVLTACSDQPADDQQTSEVVTFQSGPAGSAPADPDAGRPVERLDMTRDEKVALYDDYMRCLKDAGVPLVKDGDGRLTWNTDEAKTMSQDPAVLKVCSRKEPLRPAVTDPQRNPYYEEDRLASIKCQIARGIKWESNGGKYDGLPPDVSGNPTLEKAQQECEMQHMNGKRG